MTVNYFQYQYYTCLEDLVVLPTDNNNMVYGHKDIAEMPDDELDEHIRSTVDRWTWETGSDTDKRILDLLEGERDRRREGGFRIERVKTSKGSSTIRRVPIE